MYSFEDLLDNLHDSLSPDFSLLFSLVLPCSLLSTALAPNKVVGRDYSHSPVLGLQFSPSGHSIGSFPHVPSVKHWSNVHGLLSSQSS